jgi:predicted nucleic acid-binding protein
LAARLGDCRELWTTEAILLEIGAAFAAPAQRSFAVRIWSDLKSLPFCRVAPISGELFEKALDLFRNRADKSWSLADCASFIVMMEQRLTDALTCDQHFVQSGFHALLLEDCAPG